MTSYKNHLRRAALICATGLLLLGTFAAARVTPAAPAQNQAEISKLVARFLPRIHMTHRPWDENIAASALDIFLNALDYEHCYFLAADIEEFKSLAPTLADGLRDGDVEVAYRIYDVLRERASNRVAFVDQLLDKGFDFEKDDVYAWKRKDAPWPEDAKAWDELWRRKVKNQYITLVVSKTLADTNETDAAAAVVEGVEGEETPPPPPDLTPEESIRKSYVQFMTVITDNDAEWVFERYLTAFAQAYDPHTDYMSASNQEDFDIGMQLSLVGIGAMLTTEDGAAKIERLIAGGPAEKDGRIKPGDKIIGVAQGDDPSVDVLHWPLRKTVRLIRGEKGTKVVLTVIRASDPTGGTKEQIDILRDEVKLEEQAAKSEVREFTDEAGVTHKLGIITLPEFYADMRRSSRGFGMEPRSSTRDVKNLLVALGTQDVAGVVLDLRNNGGGLLAEAVDMTGLFIDSGPVVQVYDRRSTRILTDDDPDLMYKGPLVVLVSRQTASASEILSGALQDYGRAVIVGDSKTHGKGTVQTLASLRSDKPALGTLKVTTATFYRIAGGSTQLRGVTPDIIMSSPYDTMEIGEEYLPHAMEWTKVYPALYRSDEAIRKALPVLRERAEKRRQEDPRYVAYNGILEQLALRQKANEITLRLSDRLELARREKDLQALMEDPENPDNKAKDRDLVMIEALYVLSDLVALEHESQEALTAGMTIPAPAAILAD